MSKDKSNKEEKLEFLPVDKPKFHPLLSKMPAQVRNNLAQQIETFNIFESEVYIFNKTTNKNAFENYITTEIIPKLSKNNEEFCWSLDWDPTYFSLLIYNGFLSIAIKIQTLQILMPKLHKERCVVNLNKNLKNNQIINAINKIKNSKSLRKKINKYKLTVNTCFPKVAQGCLNRHGENWLYTFMQGVLYVLNRNKDKSKYCGVKVVSIELWEIKSNKLVAGEIGSVCGSIYTSLTGYYEISGAGVIQLCGLQQLLIQKGFKMWDLGMHLKYKNEYCSQKIPRNEFVKLYKKYRDANVKDLVSSNNVKSVKDLYLCNLKKFIKNDVEMNNNEEKKEDDKQLSKKHLKRLKKKQRRIDAKNKKKQKNNNNNDNNSNNNEIKAKNNSQKITHVNKNVNNNN